MIADRPSLRGLLHRWSVVVYVPLFAWLIVEAPADRRRLAVVVYAVAVLAMLCVSAVYHSVGISPSLHRRLKRVDHVTILLSIAGSTTPIATYGLSGTPRVLLLTSTWVAVSIGIAIRMLWIDAPPPLVAAVYLVVGWLPVLFLRQLHDGLTSNQFALVLAGGAFYTVGAIIYALKRPNPWPRAFGYHEVFHALVVAGVTAHYLAVLSLVRAA